MADAYDSSTVKQLKETAAERGLTIKSTLRKADIIQKLRENDAQADASAGESANTVVGDAPTLPVGDAPPAIETAPAQVSAVDEAEKEPTPPPHHDEILPNQLPNEPLLAEDPVVNGSTPATETLPATAEQPAEEPTFVDNTISSELATPVPTEELVEDIRKRKRRSLTPAVDAEEVAAKRAKVQENTNNDVSFTEPASGEIVDYDTNDHMEEDIVEEKAQAEVEPPKEPAALRKDVRNLFRADTSSSQHATKRSSDDDMTDDGPATSPACHLATPALYIANLKRPLQEAAIKKHLETLAAPKGSDDSQSVIKVFHLDQIKTHALVLFTSVSAASRVRSSLHDQKYPDEAGREALFVDFVPDESVEDWIRREKSASGPRWTVTYSKDGEATHHEVGNFAPSVARHSSASFNPPTGPRSSIATGPMAPPASTTMLKAPIPGANASQQPTPPTGKAFKTLESLFSNTTAKPMIYYKPVDASLAASRLKELQHHTVTSWSELERKPDMPEIRVTFEGGATLVQSGEYRGGNRFQKRPEQPWEVQRRLVARQDVERIRNARLERERVAEEKTRLAEEIAEQERIAEKREREELAMDVAE